MPEVKTVMTEMKNAMASSLFANICKENVMREMRMSMSSSLFAKIYLPNAMREMKTVMPEVQNAMRLSPLVYSLEHRVINGVAARLRGTHVR